VFRFCSTQCSVVQASSNKFDITVSRETILPQRIYTDIIYTTVDAVNWSLYLSVKFWLSVLFLYSSYFATIYGE